MQIKQLLYEERFTIDGARKRLKELHRGGGEPVKVTEDKHVATPRQMEVFTDVEHSEEEILAIDPPSASTPKSEFRAAGSNKVFMKLKKDLESLLEMLKH